MIAAVMLTAGRTVSSENSVLETIDQAGTRSITVKVEDGLTTDVLSRLRAITGIEWAGAFSTAVDASNDAIAGGPKVPVRLLYTTAFDALGLPSVPPAPGDLAYASRRAEQALGLADGTGAIRTTDDQVYGVSATLHTPDFLRDLEPVVVVPESSANGPRPVELLVIITSSPGLVAPIAAAVTSVLGVSDPRLVNVQTSQGLADVRAAVQDQLGQSNRLLVLGVVALAALLITMVMFTMVMGRRKDFGRRRALGATRTYIVLLVLVQTTITAVFGALVGLGTSGAWVVVGKSSWPGSHFALGLCVLAVGTATLAAISPAIAASRRDPITELRVP